jgi:hypothetical protein
VSTDAVERTVTTARHGAGLGIPVPGDGSGNGLHVGKAKWATGEKEGEWAGRRELAQKV